MVNFNTWSRVINGIRKESLIDHVYVNEPSSITNVKSLEPTFGDHLLIIVDLIFCTLKSTKNKIIRQWGGYSVNSINVKLSALLMELTEPDQFVSVQNHWNLLEFVLIKATDALVPLKSVNENCFVKPKDLPIHIKNAINRRKRLLKLDKARNSTNNLPTIVC